MCGLAGFFDPQQALDTAAHAEIITEMSQTLSHRGPDDAGTWCDPDAGVALGFRRLAIIDLSPQGHQPMLSHCGRYVVVFNGEIYNHRTVRAALAREVDFPWRGHSDTEVLVEAIAQWGIEKALGQFDGMFAFALWDRLERQLFLARDRIGEKPLYYGWSGNVFLFGSELKALTVNPKWQGEIDRDALALFFRHGYVPAPWSIFTGIRKLLPGHFLALARAGGTSGTAPVPRPYWSAGRRAAFAVRNRFNGNIDQATDQLEGLLRASVALRMVADVPVGAFLSGGIDSTTIVALMQSVARQPVRTYTIGFHDAPFDEAGYAREVARHLGTKHTELYVSETDALDVIPDLPHIYDEPFADASQLPTCLLAAMTRRDVVVALSGDGGDEFFGGYARYNRTGTLWHKVKRFPVGLKYLNRVLAGMVPAQTINDLLSVGGKPHHPGNRLQRTLETFAEHESAQVYRHVVTRWRDYPQLVRTGNSTPVLPDGADPIPNLDDPRSQFMLIDALTYLPDGLQTKMDRASMAHGLEVRAPLLDHKIAEFAWSLPIDMKLHAERGGKWVLRRLLHRHVPPRLVERPKMGFHVPIAQWLRSGLKDWAGDLLDENAIRRQGFLNAEPLQRRWDEHQRGCNWDLDLWIALTFQAWLQKISPA